MKKLLIGLLTMGSISAFSASLTVSYEVSGLGLKPDQVFLNYKTENLNDSHCDLADGERFHCSGTLTATTSRSINTIGTHTFGNKTSLVSVKVFKACPSGMIELTPKEGIFGIEMPMGLVANGKFDAFPDCN